MLLSPENTMIKKSSVPLPYLEVLIAEPTIRDNPSICTANPFLRSEGTQVKCHRLSAQALHIALTEAM